MENGQIFTFIDEKSSYNLYFFYGQPLLDQLSTFNKLKSSAKSFYTKSILTSMHLLNFSKNNETIGFYIDSETPYFRFKIEMSNLGTMRTLLLPDSINELPKEVTGNSRIVIAYPNKSPYSSMIELSQIKPEEVFSKHLKTSYQVQAKALIGKSSSLLIRSLPQFDVDSQFDEAKSINLEDLLADKKNFYDSTLDIEFQNEKEVIQFFESNGYSYLSSKKVRFHCPCSKERMVANLITLQKNDIEEIFQENSIEIKCDYCHKLYEVSKNEVENGVQ